MDFLVQIFNNKLLFYGIIVVICFTIFSIILIKKASKENSEEKAIDIEKVDGETSLFDEVAEDKDNNLKTSDGKLDLESMIEKMQKDIDAKASEVIEKFETEQEEKSVISYQELLENKNNVPANKEIELNNMLDDIEMDNKIEEKKNILEEVLEPKEDKEEVILTEKTDDNLKETYMNALKLEEDNLMESQSISDEISDLVSSQLNKKEDYVNAIKNGDFEAEEQHPGKFKATEFISPIYGVQDIKIQYPTVQNMKEFKNASHYKNIELEQTLNMEPLTDEIRKNEDFLNALKEFRKNLE